MVNVFYCTFSFIFFLLYVIIHPAMYASWSKRKLQTICRLDGGFNKMDQLTTRKWLICAIKDRKGNQLVRSWCIVAQKVNSIDRRPVFDNINLVWWSFIVQHGQIKIDIINSSRKPDDWTQLDHCTLVTICGSHHQLFIPFGVFWTSWYSTFYSIP